MLNDTNQVLLLVLFTANNEVKFASLFFKALKWLRLWWRQGVWIPRALIAWPGTI